MTGIDDVHRRLSTAVPEQHTSTIVHGDYLLDNCIVSRDGEIAAVLDWELCTLGDPLADVGLLLVYWSQPDDAFAALPDAPTATAGFPDRAALVERYAAASGRLVDDIDYYVALGYWKLACILAGVATRYAAGQMGSADAQALAELFGAQLDLLVTADGRAIVELKGEWDAAAVDAAVAAVAARGLERRIVFASFDARTLALAAAGSEVLSRLLILKQVPSDVVSAVAEAGARGVVVNRKAVLARPEIVDELHDAGARVVVYTLNDDDQWDAVTALGVDGIVTHDPHTLSEWQSAYAGP